MGSFIEETLLPDEKLIYRSRPHWIIFAPTAGWIVLWAVLAYAMMYFKIGNLPMFGSLPLFTILNGLALIVITLYGLMANLQYVNTEYGITNKRVLVKMGYIGRTTLEILLDKIESIQVVQSIPGRLCNYGSIIISGTGGTRDVFDNIPDPLLFRKKAQIQTDR